MKKLFALALALAMLMTCGIAALADTLLPYDGEEVVYDGYAADLGIKEDRSSEVYKAYRALTGNVTINWSTGPWADFDTKTAMFLNTGDLPDIVWLRNSSEVVANYGQMGYFLNFLDYIDYMPNLKSYLEEFSNLGYMKAENGALYCVNDIEPTDYIDECFFVNTTELKKLGLEVPRTFDEMLNAMRAYKEQNPSGTPFITYGWGESYYEYCLGSINNAQTEFYYNGEEWTHALVDTNSGYRELVGMMATMYQERLLHPEFSTMSDEQAYQIVVDGDWLFSFWYMGTIKNEIFLNDEVPYEYEAMFAPAYADGDPVYQVITVPYDNIPNWGYFVSAKVENPELMCSLVDNIISKEASTLYNWGVEGVTYAVDKNGNNYFLDDFATNGPHRKEIGVGNFMDVRYIQYKMRNTEYVMKTGVAKDAYDMIVGAMEKGDVTGIRSLRKVPNLSSADAETVAATTTPMNTYIDENIMFFIDGTRSMNEWDAFVEETLKLGDLEGVLEIYEDAEQIIYSTERKYVTYN